MTVGCAAMADDLAGPDLPAPPPLRDFSAAPLLEILAYVRARRAEATVAATAASLVTEPGWGAGSDAGSGAAVISFSVLDPDLGRGRYAGEPVEPEGPGGRRALHRPWRVWIELADRLELRMLTPRPSPAGAGHVLLRFEPLAAARWQDDAPPLSEDRTERYGARSGYARIAKAEEPGFVLDLAEALERCHLPAGAAVLDLGVNDGDELALMMALCPPLRTARFVGVDHSASALAVARARFSEEQVQLRCADLGALGPLGLGRFDLVVCLGTLQSPGVDDRALLRRVVQEHLRPRGAVLLGLPNCRYRDGELCHGARMRNFRQPELGLVVKDLAFYRKYLQQHDRQVFVTGDHTLLVTAIAR
jgi:2-polyprenyl-3-methyl-5-hydroxy-6-metoxy-1,4-benzoquinol methylase